MRADRLNERDRLHATGLRALGDGRAAEAAAAFRRLLAADSVDFVAWYLLAESVRRDTVAIADGRVLTGWRFRGSVSGGDSGVSRCPRCGAGRGDGHNLSSHHGISADPGVDE